MFVAGFLKIAEEKKKDHTVRNAVLAGTGVGAALNVGHDALLNHREKSVSNTRSLKQFTKKLQPGDILIAGSTPIHSGKVSVDDMLPFAGKALKAMGVKGKTKFTTNSHLLNAVGGGSKYHAAIYLGKNRVAHMATDSGAVNEHISDAMLKQNISAYRFKDATKRETDSAVAFSKRSIKKKVPYQAAPTYLQQVAGNMISPVGKKANRKRKDGMVCNTLPVRAYDKRKFAMGEHTYSGDLRKAKNLKVVARKDTIKIPVVLKARGIAGQATKGIKWGIGAGLAAAAYKGFKRHQESKDS